jgi:hypothetical protein
MDADNCLILLICLVFALPRRREFLQVTAPGISAPELVIILACAFQTLPTLGDDKRHRNLYGFK